MRKFRIFIKFKVLLFTFIYLVKIQNYMKKYLLKNVQFVVTNLTYQRKKWIYGKSCLFLKGLLQKKLYVFFVVHGPCLEEFNELLVVLKALPLTWYRHKRAYNIFLDQIGWWCGNTKYFYSLDTDWV